MSIEQQLTPDARQAVEEFRRRHRTAVLALLFTDIERSTALKHEMGELPSSALMARHNQVIREMLAGFTEAQEISTAGDSFFLVFAKPSDAARFALLAQLGLRELAAQTRPDFRVRMGIHLGEVAVEEDAAGGSAQDVLGMQVDVAARVSKLAGGGQILMTRGVFDNARQILKGQHLPGVGELSWLSHGPYLLKGFDEPLAVCEVGETGVAPLRQPDDCAVAKRATVPGTEPVLGWRPAVEQVVPGTEWELEKKLGEGGFGEVWLARHRRTKEQRVFKFCFRADRLRSLRREMTLFRVLKEVLGERPDIARLYNVQFEEAPYYLELEYTPGGNLADWLKKQEVRGQRLEAGEKQEVRGKRSEARRTQDSALSTQHLPSGTQDSALRTQDFSTAAPLSVRLEIVAQIATALAAAHSVGVIHKDVKPSNVLIEERKDGSVQIRLTDFGIGQLVDRLILDRAGITAAGFTETVGALAESTTGSGTRLYMAPELLAGRPPSIQSDIYSLGVLFYPMLVGDLSQPMTTDWERHVRDPLLRDDLRRCLAGTPSDRFASAADLSRQLRTINRRRAAYRIKRFAQAAVALLAVIAIVAIGAAWFQSYRRAQTEGQLYRARIELAERWVEELRYDRVRELLALCSQRLRNWEWGRLQYLCNLDLITLKGHMDTVNCVAFSPDGRRIATASYDGTAKVWDNETGRELLTLKGHGGPVYSVAFAPDGSRIATVSWDGTGKVWDSETGRELLTLSGQMHLVWAVAFSPDGRRIATASWDGTAKVWDSETGRELLTLKSDASLVFSVAFGPGGRCLAMPSRDNSAGVWDSETGRELFTLAGHTEYVCSVAFSPDGRRIATASYDRTAKLWDSETGRELLTLKGHTGRVLSVAFSPDGRHIATASQDKTAKVWDTETGRDLMALKGHASLVFSVAFSPDGQRIATASWDGTAKVWDSETARGFLILKGHSTEIHSIAFSADGQRLATASQDNTAKIWDAQTGHELLSLRGHDDPVQSVAFSPDGRQLATASSDKTAKVWESDTGRELLTLKGHNASLVCVALSPDGRRIATASFDGTAKVWDHETGRELLNVKAHSDWVLSVAFSPNGRRIATATFDNTVKVSDLEKGRELLTLKGHNARVLSVAFSLDSRLIATASEDETAKVWESQTGRELLTLKGHNAPVVSVAFSPDGRRLATASQDKTAKVWDAETGGELLTLKGHDLWLDCVAFSPDGRRIATASADGTALIWDTLPWRDEDLPGDASMSHDERVQLYKLDQWKKRHSANVNRDQDGTTGTTAKRTRRHCPHRPMLSSWLAGAQSLLWRQAVLERGPMGKRPARRLRDHRKRCAAPRACGKSALSIWRDRS
jgi:WD40 repeat protein/class 3 adenylate cyclase